MTRTESSSNVKVNEINMTGIIDSQHRFLIWRELLTVSINLKLVSRTNNVSLSVTLINLHICAINAQVIMSNHFTEMVNTQLHSSRNRININLDQRKKLPTKLFDDKTQHLKCKSSALKWIKISAINNPMKLINWKNKQASNVFLVDCFDRKNEIVSNGRRGGKKFKSILNSSVSRIIDFLQRAKLLWVNKTRNEGERRRDILRATESNNTSNKKKKIENIPSLPKPVQSIEIFIFSLWFEILIQSRCCSHGGSCADYLGKEYYSHYTEKLFCVLGKKNIMNFWAMNAY